MDYSSNDFHPIPRTPLLFRLVGDSLPILGHSVLNVLVAEALLGLTSPTTCFYLISSSSVHQGFPIYFWTLPEGFFILLLDFTGRCFRCDFALTLKQRGRRMMAKSSKLIIVHYHPFLTGITLPAINRAVLPLTRKRFGLIRLFIVAQTTVLNVLVKCDVMISGYCQRFRT